MSCSLAFFFSSFYKIVVSQWFPKCQAHSSKSGCILEMHVTFRYILLKNLNTKMKPKSQEILGGRTFKSKAASDF